MEDNGCPGREASEAPFFMSRLLSKPYRRRSEQHFNNASMTNDESCPLGCKSKHRLASCPVFQESTVNQRWEIVREDRRCRKCLRVSYQTNDCKRADGTSCDKCKKNHHCSLHKKKKNKPLQSNLNPVAEIFTGQSILPEVGNRSIQGKDNEETIDVKTNFLDLLSTKGQG